MEFYTPFLILIPEKFMFLMLLYMELLYTFNFSLVCWQDTEKNGSCLLITCALDLAKFTYQL